MNKAGKYLGTVLPLLLALAIQVLGAAWIGIAYSVVRMFQLASRDGADLSNAGLDIVTEVQDPQFLMVISAVFGIVGIIVFGLWLRHLNRGDNTRVTANHLTVKQTGIIIVLGIFLQIGLSIVLTVISNWQPGWFKGYGELMEKLGMGNSLASFLYVGIIGPIAEELIFRGVTLGKAKRVMPFFAANILQALLFGIYHMNIIQGTYAFAIGLCFGLVRFTYNTLKASIALHMSVNLSGIFLGYILSDSVLLNPVSGGLLFVASAVVIAASLIYFIRLLKNVEIEEELYTFEEN
ncbi:CPBP family intramembrane glutamic endopeptidase [Anaerocolumna chitinilytica]|uniref:CAAX prenyl protease 2/Lysostaphin resistance protein A-like domain-containing protein n=1 Tax=Anaerocolumna chitinilytica TaxID=1727145 RepID=A0A7M3SB32_9FIRM|nr:CPBP family intramembrane glutamic endopeptidase [Anaerocolumna chitinilytica]BCK01800.1 hypothetical protein bsdcttw_48400 [Anaerocolumna chitinilytica]